MVNILKQASYRVESASIDGTYAQSSTIQQLGWSEFTTTLLNKYGLTPNSTVFRDFDIYLNLKAF